MHCSTDLIQPSLFPYEIPLGKGGTFYIFFHSLSPLSLVYGFMHNNKIPGDSDDGCRGGRGDDDRRDDEKEN